MDPLSLTSGLASTLLTSGLASNLLTSGLASTLLDLPGNFLSLLGTILTRGVLWGLRWLLLIILLGSFLGGKFTSNTFIVGEGAVTFLLAVGALANVRSANLSKITPTICSHSLAVLNEVVGVLAEKLVLLFFGLRTFVFGKVVDHAFGKLSKVAGDRWVFGVIQEARIWVSILPARLDAATRGFAKRHASIMIARTACAGAVSSRETSAIPSIG